ncbi:MAG: M48 family metallopeptidase [Minisyncoccales bacterium]
MNSVYEIVRSNQRKTIFLISAFLSFVVILGWIFSQVFANDFILYLAVFFALSQSFLSYWYSDKIPVFLVAAKEISKKDYPQIYRLVENLAIGAGIMTPKIFIAPERQPNAFAAGRDEKHAVIVLNQGLIDLLEEKEIEGVIAHEISHIKNRDILIASVAVVLVSFIALLSNFFFRMSIFSGSRREREGQNPIFFIIFLILAILAPLIAQLIHFAISRKREFLADGSAVLLTRYPQGLISALEKISQNTIPLKRENPHLASLYISNPFKQKNQFSKLFSTHPPVEERIEALKKISF